MRKHSVKPSCSDLVNSLIWSFQRRFVLIHTKPYRVHQARRASVGIGIGSWWQTSVTLKRVVILPKVDSHIGVWKRPNPSLQGTFYVLPFLAWSASCILLTISHQPPVCQAERTLFRTFCARHHKNACANTCQSTTGAQDGYMDVDIDLEAIMIRW